MYQLDMQVKPEHIDFQDIMDGLYYPFYFEECRHKFLHDVIGIDIQEFSQQGNNLVLVEYSLKFKSSLKKDDTISVTCELLSSPKSRTKFAIGQTIICNAKVAAAATFIVTCLPTAGGRPFIPEAIAAQIPAE